MTAEEDARPAHGRVVGIERDAGRPGEESLDRDAGLEAGEWRAYAEVKTATEGEVGSTSGAVDVLMRARGPFGRRPVGSRPEQKQAAVGRDGHFAEASTRSRANAFRIIEMINPARPTTRAAEESAFSGFIGFRFRRLAMPGLCGAFGCSWLEARDLWSQEARGAAEGFG